MQTVAGAQRRSRFTCNKLCEVARRPAIDPRPRTDRRSRGSTCSSSEPSPHRATAAPAARPAHAPRARIDLVAALAPVSERVPPADAPPSSAGSPADESALIERVRRGDAAAFDALARRYLRRAYAVAYRILGHREDAEDLVQEAFMAALDRIETFEAGRPFGPWFFRILTNRGLNARKARAIRRTDEVPDTAADRGGSPHADAERAEVRERLHAALDAMPERQRVVVQLIEVEGMTAAEVAAMLDIAPGTVRWYLHEARATLRTVLAPLHGDEG